MEDRCRPVPDYGGGYLVSRDGEVYSLKRNKLLAKVRIGRDYVRVNLYDGGRVRHHLVHRLVAAAFLGRIPHGFEVNHKDGDKGNNDVSNPEIVTRDENRKHAQRNGLPRRGEANAKAKPTEAKVREIRQLREGGAHVRELARKFDVTEQSIYAVCNRRTWAHVE
jgi:hypothetical protein